MGRPRTKDYDLPSQLYLKHGSYYFVRDGKWLNLGRDRSLAARKALRLKDGYKPKSDERYPIRFLYVIGVRGQLSPVKVGIAMAPWQRLAKLQTGHHEKLEIKGCIQVDPAQAKTIERRIHQWLKAHRLSGEWFGVEFTPTHWVDLIQLALLDVR